MCTPPMDGMPMATWMEAATTATTVAQGQMLRLNGRGVLRAVATEPRLALTHRFVLITAHDVIGDGESAALLRDL